MSNRRVLILVVAMVVAGLTAFATMNYVSAADDRAMGDAELVDVYMVKKEIIKGFPGDQALDGGFIVKDRIPRKFYPVTALTQNEIQGIRGKVAVAPLAAGVPVVSGSFADSRIANESFAQRIDKGMVAVTLSIDSVQGVARLIVPGDKVNLMSTMDDPRPPAPGAEKDRMTTFVLQGIEVLAVGNAAELQPGEVAATSADQAAAGQVQTIDSSLMTFLVSPLDAERLVHASKTGDIHLSLLPPDYAPAPVAPVSNANLVA